MDTSPIIPTMHVSADARRQILARDGYVSEGISGSYLRRDGMFKDPQVYEIWTRRGERIGFSLDEAWQDHFERQVRIQKAVEFLREEGGTVSFHRPAPWWFALVCYAIIAAAVYGIVKLF